MAIEPYKKHVPLKWKNADFNSLVDICVDNVNIGKNKRVVLRQRIYYTTCKSSLCKHKESMQCPVMENNEKCMCPNGITNVIEEPSRYVKMHGKFMELVDKIQYFKHHKEYSDFIWTNRNYKLTNDDYEILKQIPEFSLKSISTSKYDLHEILQLLEDNKEHDNYKTHYHRGPICDLMTSLRTHYYNEVDTYKKLLTMEAFLDKDVVKYKKFKERVGQLFEFCGEYIIVNIPFLTNFEFYGMENIFVYPDTKEYYNSRRYNAVRTEDFPHIYNYLINIKPQAYNSEEYHLLYIPLIKEQFPQFCKDNNINFTGTTD